MTRVVFEGPSGPPFEAELGRVIAEGGGGVVQEAVRADAVAIVVKRARSGGEQLLDYERRTCGGLEHPSLVRFLGAASPPGLGPLLAFEALGPNPLLALNGPSMRPAWRDPGTPYFPLPPGRAIELAFDLLLALDHLHERNLVHADVKLSNLLVRVPGPRTAAEALRSVSEGRFQGVLIDLGSVRATSVLDAISRGHADPALIPSVTPLYAPPEALFESSGTGGRKVFSRVMDTYSFALVFYALLTGRVPYAHAIARERLEHTEAVLDAKNRETRGALSPVDYRALARIPLHDVGFEGPALAAWPDFHATAREVLRRCLEPDPSKRVDTRDARTLFQEGFKMRPGDGRWTQGLFQMRPTSSRLLRDAPLGGIRVREESGGEVAAVEAPPPRSEPAPRRCVDAEGSHVAFAGRAPAPIRLVPLAHVLRALRAQKPLPVKAPAIVTRPLLAPTELLLCALCSLDGRRVTAGRAHENDIVIGDASVSKSHLFLERDPDGVDWVVDAGSSNGTSVDEEPLPRNGRARLGGCATIALGPSSRIAYLDGAALAIYLANALELWARTFATKDGRLAHIDDEGPSGPGVSTEVVQLTPLAMPRSAPAARASSKGDALDTRRSRAPLATTKEELASKLPGIADVASFGVLFEGARVEDCETAAEVLALLGGAEPVLGVDALLRTGKKVVVYRPAR